MNRRPMETDTKRSSFKAGMYLLETLTSGMYNEPLAIYREYIQNAVDSIDHTRGKTGKRKVKIKIDPFDRSITITDNGMGIPIADAKRILSSVGDSDKRDGSLRGFRGIGRLGGLAFCDRAIFRTKAVGERVESVQEWDCRRLRGILANGGRSRRTLKHLFDDTTSFYRNNGKGSTNSYFSVRLEGVTSFRNYVLDLQKVRNYLCKVAPLPFDESRFTHGYSLASILRKTVPGYSSYDIYLNGDQLYKPYHDELRTTKKGRDRIESVERFEIEADGQVVAHGWYGHRRDLLGSIARADLSSGIRVRVGNIAIGDEHLLDECFREPRFNGYVVGEIYAHSPDLIPNSRRDDFVDNKTKTLFYNAVEQAIGLPISKEIRLRSKLGAEGGMRKETHGALGRSAEGGRTAASGREGAGATSSDSSTPSHTRLRDAILEEAVAACKGCSKATDLLHRLRLISSG